MSSPLFRTQTFPVEGSEKAACLITGYGGKIARYQSVIQSLNEQGFTVIAYEHGLSVLTSGNPHDLLDLVDGTGRHLPASYCAQPNTYRNPRVLLQGNGRH